MSVLLQVTDQGSQPRFDLFVDFRSLLQFGVHYYIDVYMSCFTIVVTDLLLRGSVRTKQLLHLIVARISSIIHCQGVCEVRTFEESSM